MNVDRLRTHLDEIQQVAQETMAFLDGMSKEAFLKDVIRQRAVAMNLLMIGEAAAHIIDEFPDFASEFADVPWRKIRGMRNRIAHGYMSIDLDTVWDTVQTAIPALIDVLYRVRHWRAEGE